MIGSTIFVGWKNSTGGSTVSERIASGFYLPSMAPNQSQFQQTEVPTKININSTGGIKFSFVIKDVQLETLAIQSKNFIFAFSDVAASNPDQASSSFLIHSKTGIFNLDASTILDTVSTTSLTKSSYTKEWIQFRSSATKTISPETTTALFSTTDNSIFTKLNFVLSTTQPNMNLNKISRQSGSDLNTTSKETLSGFFDDTYCYDLVNTFCMSSIANLSGGTISFTLQTSYPGWIGIGIGSSMASATAIFVGWYNTNLNPIISQRQSARHTLPQFLSDQSLFTIVSTPSSVNIAKYTQLVLSFQIPLTMISIIGPTSFIFGVSNGNATYPDLPSSDFPRHNLFGVFQLDLSKSTSTGITEFVPGALIILHGVFMVAAWFVIPSIAIFTARFLKNRLGHLWYKIHTGLMIGGCGSFLILGLVMVELNQYEQNNQMFRIESNHAKIGIAVVFAGYPLQVLLGYILNARFSKDRVNIPWWDRLHWWIGRVVFLLALVTIFLGLRLAHAGIEIVIWYVVMIAVVGTAFVVAEVQIGASLHVHVMAGEERVVVEERIEEREADVTQIAEEEK
ncbi:hypothetical protein HK100_008323 [Physocladia obscura]|uniref:Cytochrome b561 domain-containing protein n=1 Tax=Physocladia obscura TaxID=109957 RepID=A0AAD5XFK0_9FUNG|nr:hypothetical protein HK100_008323 [Physocladia obscura]